MNFDTKIQEIESLLENHRELRENSLNLIASENIPSPLVESLLAGDLDHRYGNYSGINLRDRLYQGNRFIAQIEELTHDLAKQLFGVTYVDFRPLSGNIAGIATTFALGSHGDTVLEVDNGHRYAHKLATSSLQVELQSVPIPWDGVNYNIDLDATIALIRKHRPKLVIIGSALFLFPQPVRELKEAMNKYNPGSYLIYDAAHVMGLIAGGRFQSPLQEGADVIISSTHKTLAGPQGGMILTNDREIAERIGPAIAPLLVSNHHLSRLPALAGTFLEWMSCGNEHASAIINNARALGRALHERGLRLVGAELGFTESHTLLPIVDEFGASQKLADRLEACNIITGTANVPEELGTYGLRLGVQEVTRRGMTEADAPEIADCIVEVLNGHKLTAVKQQVLALVQRFKQIRFTLGHT
ncbi:aminotransferase class I/II-fold pyridoxal phosphate-dependent enzyme [Candidatus Poribacteria bacterium]|nr:aminotransferase class I/II-fold pyridoxal phosphate-dependent enzyme [Candidatus Poribacteria bacterium]